MSRVTYSVMSRVMRYVTFGVSHRYHTTPHHTTPRLPTVFTVVPKSTLIRGTAHRRSGFPEMNPTDTAHLVERIIQTWPTGPKGRIWTEALTPLDAGRAGAAYVRLRAEAEHPPSVARFLMVYRSLHTQSSDRALSTCETCGGDGWVTREYQRGERTYRGAFPCTCPAGQENQRIWNEVNTYNERSRRIIGIHEPAHTNTEELTL